MQVEYEQELLDVELSGDAEVIAKFKADNAPSALPRILKQGFKALSVSSEHAQRTDRLGRVVGCGEGVSLMLWHGCVVCSWCTSSRPGRMRSRPGPSR